MLQQYWVTATAGAESGQLAVKSRNGPIGAQITDIIDAWRRGQEDPAVTGNEK